MGYPAHSVPAYVVKAKIQFCSKYGVKEPHLVTRKNPAAMREWCDLVLACKELYAHLGRVENEAAGIKLLQEVGHVYGSG